MVADKNRHYNLIKKKHIFPSILGLIIGYCLLIIIGRLALDGIIGYLCDSKLETEYERVCYMTDIYESVSDEQEALAVLEKEGRDFIITDKDNNVLAGKGKNTCSFEGGMAECTSETEKIRVYYDNEVNCIELSKDDVLGLKLGTTFSTLKEKGIFSALFTSDEEERNLEVSLPFWISKDTEDGSRSLIAKAAFDVKMRDLGIVIIIALIIAFFAIVMFCKIMFGIITKFSNRKKLLSVFFTDVATKGHNWMWFTIKGEQMLRKKSNDKRNFAVLNITFVKYNTFCVCHSVEEGEEALQSIYRSIMKTLQKNEACAHHGAASFAILLQYEDEEILKKRAKLLLKYLKGTEKVHQFGFHIGIAMLPAIQTPSGKFMRRSSIDIEKVYNDACAAAATLSGTDDSGIAFFDNKLVEEQKWIDTVNEKQRSAVDNEEFVVFYQPKYNPSTDELKGAEALIRWQSPEFGFIPPGKFIPIFEKNGFITEIDHYMLTRVARDQKRWIDMGYACVPVSVNVSRAHFIESDLAEQIRDAVDREGAPRNLIEIELTESAFFDDKKALITTIEKLKSYGFSVSMDDFGAGYSSLNSLKDMPLDVLKLDADFFRGESSGNRGEIVVSEAIRLAKSLNMRTVAEGVEVKEQVDFLAGQGCDMIQGYYYAKPMPGNEYEERMRMQVIHPDGDEAEAVPETGENVDAVLESNEVSVNSLTENPLTEVREAVGEKPEDVPETPLEITDGETM